MTRRLTPLLLIALLLPTLACILETAGPATISDAQIATYAAETMAYLQYQTYIAAGTQNLPPANTSASPADTNAPPPAQAAPTDTAFLPTVTQTPFIPSVTNTPPPCNWARFVSDVTVPDNWETGPLDHFTKTWRLQNAGSCTWTSGYSLVFDHGDQMGAPASQQLTAGTVAPGGTIDVSVDLLSPAAPGTYQGFFKLRASDSTVFGIGDDHNTAFWVKIVVGAAAGPSIQQVDATTSIHSGSTGSVTAACPAGTVVTGGGFSVSNDVLIYTQAMNGNGWTAVAKNNAGVDRTLRVYAECLTYPGAGSHQVESNTTVNAGTHGSATASCPAGSVVTGGGFTSSPDGSMWVYASWQNGNGWQASEKNTGGAAKLFHVYAVCLSGTPLASAKTTATGNIPAGGNAAVQVACPAGKVATGGGWGLSDDELPYFSGFSSGYWRVYAHNTSGSLRSLLTAVTCLG
jgi:hypothetical protein